MSYKMEKKLVKNISVYEFIFIFSLHAMTPLTDRHPYYSYI